MLIRKLENMACAKELLNMGKGPKEIGKLLGMKEYPVKITVNQSRNAQSLRHVFVDEEVRIGCARGLFHAAIGID